MEKTKRDLGFDLNHKPVGDFFKSSQVKYIPIFQRPYVWKDKQIIKLIDDIISYYEKSKFKLSAGTIIAIKEDQNQDVQN